MLVFVFLLVLVSDVIQLLYFLIAQSFKFCYFTIIRKQDTSPQIICQQQLFTSIVLIRYSFNYAGKISSFPFQAVHRNQKNSNSKKLSLFTSILALTTLRGVFRIKLWGVGEARRIPNTKNIPLFLDILCKILKILGRPPPLNMPLTTQLHTGT